MYLYAWAQINLDVESALFYETTIREVIFELSRLFWLVNLLGKNLGVFVPNLCPQTVKNGPNWAQMGINDAK